MCTTSEVLANMLACSVRKMACRWFSNQTGLRDMLVPIKERGGPHTCRMQNLFSTMTQRPTGCDGRIQIGRGMDVEASIKAINDALLRGEHTVSLVVNEAQPRVPATATGTGTGHHPIDPGRDILFLWFQRRTHAKYRGCGRTFSWCAGCARRDLLDGRDTWAMSASITDLQKR